MSSIQSGRRSGGARPSQADTLGRLRLSVLRAPPLAWRYGSRGGCEIVIAPPDLRTADPTVASDIYCGHFALAGQLVSTGGHSIFTMPAPSAAWSRALHAFGWLRHLRAADTALARSNGRTLIEDWMSAAPPLRAVAYEPKVAARRVLSWLAQSPVLLEESEHDFYLRFVRSVSHHALYLLAASGAAPAGPTRITALVASAAAALSLSRHERVAQKALKRLDRELERQILPDGVHVSRDPGVPVDLLLDLLPLREALVARDRAPSEALIGSIERMLPMLRFFRHGDGAFAQMNGMGATPQDAIATVLSYDEACGVPVSSARYAAYERIDAGESVVIADVGSPPPPRYGGRAHAGALAFEFSCGAQRLVVNCGATRHRQPELRRLTRMTAAHSTAVIADTSQRRFKGRRPDAPLAGRFQVSVNRQGKRLEARHDAYRKRFRVDHVRRLALSDDGRTLTGADLFEGKRRKRSLETVLRFHLHPDLEVRIDENDDILLGGSDGMLWAFRCDAPFRLMQSVSVSDVHGLRESFQIAVSIDLKDRREVEWSFVRLDGDVREAESEEQDATD